MEKDRLGAFIDAVLAIIMTILVLELKSRRRLTGHRFGHSGRISSPMRFLSSGLALCG